MAETSNTTYHVHMLSPDEIIPYEGNPRDNEAAVEAVLASIMQFGFRVPLLLDEDNVIVAGHTRHKAVQRILERDPSLVDRFGKSPCFKAHDLTEDQIRAFRLVDNKTSELAEWNFDLLANEVALLGDAGIDLEQFGWSAEEIDCLKSVVAEDCLDPSTWLKQDGDGVSAPIVGKGDLISSTDGSSIRVTVGSFGFMVLREDYDAWFDEVMKEHAFDYDRANVEIAKRLGLHDAVLHRDQFIREQQEALYAAESGETAAAEETEEAAPASVEQTLAA